MMQLKNLTLFGRRPKHVGHPASLRKAEERIETLGWLCMAATLPIALLLAAYAAI